MSKRIKYTDAVPNSIVTRYKEDNTQYLLDQVSRLTAENAMLKEKWLAQPEPEQELVTDKPTETAMAVMPNGVCVSNVYDAYEEGRKSVMSEQQAEAWIIVNKETGYRTQVSDLTPFLYHREIFEVIPLYTAPPKREPLSESKIAAIWDDSDYDVAVVRRIEKAHGIGENDE